MDLFNKIFSRINYKLIVIHFVAISFIAMGSRQFNQLFNLDIVKAVHQFHIDQIDKKKKFTDQEMKNLDSFANHVSLNGYSSKGKRMTYILIYRLIWYLSGAFLALGISLFVAYKKKVFWINSVIAFLLALYLATILFSVRWINMAVYFTSSFLLQKFRYRYEIIFDGIFFIAIGLFLILNRRIRNFIVKQSKKPEEVEVPI